MHGAEVNVLLQSSLKLPDSESFFGYMGGGKAFVLLVGLFFDVMWIVTKVLLSLNQKALGSSCEAVGLAVWYSLTVMTFGWAFKEKKDMASAIDMANQQITSIGYGSDTAVAPEQRVFHGLNGVASQLGPNNFLFDLMPSGDSPFQKFLLLCLSGLAVWTLFSADGAKGIDPFYTTLITATTIGYGDIAPSHDWSKIFSAFLTPMLIKEMGEFFDGGDGNKLVGYENMFECGHLNDPDDMESRADRKLKVLDSIGELRREIYEGRAAFKEHMHGEDHVLHGHSGHVHRHNHDHQHTHDYEGTDSVSVSEREKAIMLGNIDELNEKQSMVDFEKSKIMSEAQRLGVSAKTNV